METWARAHKQTTAQATIQEVLHRSRCFAHRSSRARGLIRGWIQTAWRMDALPKKSHQRSQSTGCVLVRKAPTTPHSQATAPQAKDRWGLQGRPRWGIRQLTEAECQYPVHLARLRGRVGDLSLFALLHPFTHASHGLSSPTTENISSVVVIHREVCQTKPLL